MNKQAMKAITALMLCAMLLMPPVTAMADPTDDGGLVPPEEQHLPAELTNEDDEGIAMFAMEFDAQAIDCSYMKVLLSTNHESVNVTFTGTYSVKDQNASSALLTSGSTYTISKTSSGVSIATSGGGVIKSGTALTITQHTDSGSFKLYNTHYSRYISYKGDLLCSNRTLNSQSGLQLINKVYIEDYVTGSIGYEMGNDQDLDALKAQAICARGYAVYLAQTYSSRAYTMLDTSTNQVYRGIVPTTSDWDNVRAAVSATSKQILTYNGNVVQSIYGATNGGQIDTAYNRWGSGCLVDPSVDAIKDDPYDLAYTKANYRNLYEEVTIYKQPAMSAGANLSATNKLIEMALLPQIPGATASNVSVSSISITPIQAARHENCYHAVGFTVVFTYDYNGQTGLTTTATIPETDLYVSPSNGKPYGWFQYSQLTAYRLFDNSDGTYTLAHLRWGHSVGMSQYGARQMANEGKSYQEILAFYYWGESGTTITTYSAITDKAALPSSPTSSFTLVTTRPTKLYTSASTGSAVKQTVAANTSVTGTGVSGSFYAVSVGSVTGYMLITDFDPIYTHVRVVNVTTSCNVRLTPTVGTSNLAGTAPKGAVYALLEANVADTGGGGMIWHKIQYTSAVQAYISSDYAELTVSEETPDDPTAYSYDVTVDLPAGYSGTELIIDGIAYDANDSVSGKLTVPLTSSAAKTVQMYKYNASGIPIGMYIWSLNYSGGKYTAYAQSNLEDLLTYHGFSIRVTNPAGIRFKAGIKESLRKNLISSNVGGFKLVEYGTLIMNNNLYEGGQYPFVRGGEKIVSTVNYGTTGGKKVDIITEKDGTNIRFAAVLINQPQSAYAVELAFRAYIVLEKNGVQYTYYSAPQARTIHYLASQLITNTTAYPEGSSARKYLQGIIDYVNNN